MFHWSLPTHHSVTADQNLKLQDIKFIYHSPIQRLQGKVNLTAPDETIVQLQHLDITQGKEIDVPHARRYQQKMECNILMAIQCMSCLLYCILLLFGWH